MRHVTFLIAVVAVCGCGGGGGGKGAGSGGKGGGYPSTTGNPSGGGRTNNPPSK
jgi:hypothetical protein